MSFVRTFLSDARLSLRSLARTPGFWLAASATLALGIAVSTALFSVVDAVLLRPLPYSEPEQRVMVWSRWVGYDKTWVSDAELLDYRRFIRSFAQVAAWDSGQANLTGDGEPARVGLALVTPNLFATLGATPLLGRTFTDDEAAPPNGLPVAFLGHGLWQRPWLSVVGIVGDVRHNGLRAPIKEKFYRPHAQFHLGAAFLAADLPARRAARVDPAGALRAD